MSKNKGKNKSQSNSKPNIKLSDLGASGILKQENENTIILPQAKKDSIELTRPEYEELILIKKAFEDKDISGLSDYKKSKEIIINQELEKDKKAKIKEIEAEIKQSKLKIENDINEKITATKELLKKAQEEKTKLDKEIATKNKSFKDEYEKKMDDTNQQVKDLLDKAEKDVKEMNVNYEIKINAKQLELNTRENKVEERENIVASREVEFEFKEKTHKTKEIILSKKEEIYADANPEKILTLENEIEQKKSYIEELRAQYLSLQKSIEESEMFNLKINGRNAEELLKENEQLSLEISKLDDKCNRFTEFDLVEMKRARDEEPNLHWEIKERTREIQEKTGELNRLKNNVLELEQLKAQMGLVRTLNDHLRVELETSKRALESRVGEVCPALTLIDFEEKDEKNESKINYEKRELLKSKKGSQASTLREIVDHVKNYASSQKDPLYYSAKDIRAFLAGLAASKFSILQGLSGTGKTSLPKVFMDAIYGERRIVPVESSWRDRNELLGYYNDFNKKFTAKEFTCHLYRAGMPNYSDTPFFIILDEMNLSRVEYYFADFLSVLEDNDKSKWEIKLVDADLRSLPSELQDNILDFIEQEGNQRIIDLKNNIYSNDNKLNEDIIDPKEKLEFINYLSRYTLKNSDLHSKLLGGPQNLINGNTIKIPENIWFIGTANRDESTFEISDKVYDRAQILNFNKRASGIKGKYSGSLYTSYKTMNNLFEEAIETSLFDSQTDQLIQKIDKLMIEKFKISFGNRITMQMDKFVPVYIEAGKSNNIKDDDLRREAIDYQLTNKVLRKLEYKQASKENLENLKKVFEEEKLSMGAEFIDWKIQNEG